MANYKYLAATDQTKVGAGKLYGIFVSTTTSGTITVYAARQALATQKLLTPLQWLLVLSTLAFLPVFGLAKAYM